MTQLLRRLPIESNDVLVRGQRVRIKRPQIVVWVSINPREHKTWDARVPRFPAILDTGNSHSFLIRESHLIEWAGIIPSALREFGSTRLSGVAISQRLACLYLHRNIRGKRDSCTETEPFFLSTENGIAVCSDHHPRAPRLPLLELRSLIRNKLILTINGGRHDVCLRRPLVVAILIACASDRIALCRTLSAHYRKIGVLRCPSVIS